MSLPHLDQLVELSRGQAAHVARAVRLVQRELLHRDPAKKQLLASEALALKPLARVLKALAGPIARDLVPPRPRAKPHRVRLAFDELTVLRLLYARLLATAHQADPDDPADEHHDPERRALLLATALGAVYQRSLNLATHITLPPVLPAR